MRSQTSGSSNVAIGTAALFNSTEGIGNVAIGNSSLLSSSTAGFNIGIGYASMQSNTTGTCNIGIGICSHDFLDGGCNNVALGFRAAANLSTGCYNVSIGDSVCLPNGSGNCQLVIGFSATENWLTGNSTKAIKPGAGIIDCANSCGTAGQVLASNGANALCWTSLPGVATSSTLGTVYGQPGSLGNNLVSYGYGALGLGAGERMTAFGKNALPQVSEFACDNNAFGYNAFPNLTFGNRNTGIGGGSFGFGTTLTTGNNNTVIGNGADVAAAGSSNSITLGNSSITVIRAQVTTITALSDARDKTNVTALPVGLDFINSLNPVKFTWEMREPNEVKDGTSEAGFIAQDLQSAQAAADADYLGLVYDENPEKLEASAGKLIPVLVKAIQELSAKVEALEAKQSN